MYAEGICPVWSYSLRSNHCDCAESLGGGIICSGNQVLIRVDCTMTTYPQNNETVASLNVYGYDNYSAVVNRVFTVLPPRSQDLNASLCVPNHRKGFLCEDCSDGFGPSSNLLCLNCTQHSIATRVLFFVILKLAPMTVMFILLLLFRFNVTQGPKFGYIIFCLGHTMTIRLLSPFQQLMLHQLTPYQRVIFNILTFLSSIWDMDYSSLFSFLCISSSLNNMDVILLHFVTAAYPLVLVAISYGLIQLRNKNYLLVVFLWKPFEICLHKFRREWNVAGSIVHAYATLFILSFNSFLFNAYMMLKITTLYSKEGEVRNILYYQPSIQFNSVRFVLHVLLVLLLMITLAVIPTIILFTQSVKTLRRKLNLCCSQRVQIVLNIFGDTIQGSFKDRYRVLLAIAASVAVFITFCGVFAHLVDMSLVSINLVVLLLASIFIAFAKPFKSLLTNISVCFHGLVMTAISISVSHYIRDIGPIGGRYPLIILCLASIPHVFMLVYIVVMILHKTRVINVQKLFQHDQTKENLLPYRLQNSLDC